MLSPSAIQRADEAIHALETSGRPDQLTLRRLKKQKLQLKEEIERLSAADRLAKALDLLADRCHDRHDLIWRVTIRPAQMALFRQGGAGKAMRRYMDRQWVEYVMLGEPFGVLGLDAEGQVSWLQLRTRTELLGVAEAGHKWGLPEDVLAALKEGRNMISPELQTSLGLHGPGTVQPTIPLDENGELLAALFPVKASDLPETVQGYRPWLAKQRAREIST